jgi:Circularly permutated YpsA SLOG family
MIEKIISGGQTGVDQAGLDFAIEYGIPHGGTVPKGRLSEAGPIPDRYHMIEHISPGYPPRTEANVRDADATAIFTNGPINEESGSLLTASLCLKLKKPYVVISLMDDEEAGVKALWSLVGMTGAKILNVAGSRGSRKPDVAKVRRILAAALCPEKIVNKT